MEADVKLSDLLDAETNVISGNFYLELISCSSYQDSRLDSQEFIKAKDVVPYIFSYAEPVECFSQNLQSYAHFRIPITLSKSKSTELASNDHLNIITNQSWLLLVALIGIAAHADRF